MDGGKRDSDDALVPGLFTNVVEAPVKGGKEVGERGEG